MDEFLVLVWKRLSFLLRLPTHPGAPSGSLIFDGYGGIPHL